MKSPDLCRRWLPSSFLRYSAGLQITGGTLAGIFPEYAPQLLAVLAANHAIIAGANFFPRSGLLGPNLVRLPEPAKTRGEIVLSFDDGPDLEVTPRVLAILAEYRVPANFFCIVRKAVAYPDLIRAIQHSGHHIGNHSYWHAVSFALQSIGAIRHELRLAQDTLASLTGVYPHYFRAPAGMRNPWLQPVLSEFGLTLVSWTRRGFDTVNGDPLDVTRRLLHKLRAGDILLLHDAGSALSKRRQPVVLEVLPRLLDAILARGLTPVTLKQCMAE